MKTFKIISIFCLLTGFLVSQEMAGFELMHSARYIGDLKTQSRTGVAGYRYYTSYGTRVGLFIGVNQYKFLNDNKKSIFMESPSALILKAELHQTLSTLYVHGATQYYHIDGEISSRAEGNSNIIYHNYYEMFEFPIGLGMTLNHKDITASVGVLKTYFYGTNEIEILVDTEGHKASLGTDNQGSFTDELPIAGEINVVYNFSKLLNIELNYTQFSKKDFAIQMSFWSPF
jgi:hypothetical protein